MQHGARSPTSLTHLPLDIEGEAEEQRDIEAQFHDVVPVLRWKHGLHKHIKKEHDTGHRPPGGLQTRRSELLSREGKRRDQPV